MASREQLEKWLEHQSKGIGNIKELLREVLEKQKQHSAQFDRQATSHDDLRRQIESQDELLDTITVVLVG